MWIAFCFPLAFAVSLGYVAANVPFILVVLWMLPKGATSHLTTQKFDFRQMRSNVRQVVSQPMLRGALVTVFVSSVLCAPLVVFSPILVKVSLSGDISQFRHHKLIT